MKYGTLLRAARLLSAYSLCACALLVLVGWRTTPLPAGTIYIRNTMFVTSGAYTLPSGVVLDTNSSLYSTFDITNKTLNGGPVLNTIATHAPYNDPNTGLPLYLYKYSQPSWISVHGVTNGFYFGSVGQIFIFNANLYNAGLSNAINWDGGYYHTNLAFMVKPSSGFATNSVYYDDTAKVFIIYDNSFHILGYITNHYPGQILQGVNPGVVDGATNTTGFQYFNFCLTGNAQLSGSSALWDTVDLTQFHIDLYHVTNSFNANIYFYDGTLYPDVGDIGIRYLLPASFTGTWQTWAIPYYGAPSTFPHVQSGTNFNNAVFNSVFNPYELHEDISHWNTNSGGD